ncbi:MAG TPA: HAD-IG family 5'-nucleotidase [Acidimicrobiia bacterium]|nr:HAD-IG family 5'-nucleotidase [Acidimicrobiia bacterium]
MPSSASPPPERRIYGNRTLNLRSIRAIGYDMDYTLIHYRVDEWESRAFGHARARLADRGWPVDDLVFDPDSVIRGLTIDLEQGNLVKPTRFGYVIRAAHGTEFLEFDRLRTTYHGVTVDLAEQRWVFLNTLFSLSEAALYSQLVDRYDAGVIPGVRGYAELYDIVRTSLDEAHMEGRLKEEIVADPKRFVVADPEMPLTLLDQRHAGKKVVLITNAEWEYTDRMMRIAFDRHLPAEQTWRDLFDAVIVSAAKPEFFTARRPLYRIVEEGLGLMRPHLGALDAGSVYVGGSARMLEDHLGVSGDEILYVGDHLYSDVSVSKALLRWRTALVLRELETEITATEAFRPKEEQLRRLMEQKAELEHQIAWNRLARQRAHSGYAPADTPPAEAEQRIEELRTALTATDEQITPLAIESGRLRNKAWGPLMRSGNDKSLFARQVERYADVYTSRASNFLAVTPYGYLRADRGSLPHDV